jgi:hypothetical protein
LHRLGSGRRGRAGSATGLVCWCCHLLVVTLVSGRRLRLLAQLLGELVSGCTAAIQSVEAANEKEFE